MEKVPDTDRLLDSLPYRLTGAQQRVWSEIEADLQKENAMNRLVQGGCGQRKNHSGIPGSADVCRKRQAGLSHGAYGGPGQTAL